MSEGPRQDLHTSQDPVATELARRYTAGESIRALAVSTGRSYGSVHRALSEAGITLRGRQHRKAARSDRLGLRASAEQVDLIQEAAAIEGKTVSAFMMDTVTARAHAVISDHRDLVLSPEAFELFYTELDKPAHAVPELAELFRRPGRLPARLQGSE